MCEHPMLCAHQVDESHLTGESEEVLKEAVGSPLVVSGSKVSSTERVPCHAMSSQM
jgi:high-affinity K+ transport system ATPase subunit B